MSVGSDLSGSLGKVTNDRGVGVEKVITGHSRLTGNTGGDDNNFDTLERISKLISLVTSSGGRSVDVRNVSSNTGSKTNIVQAQVGNERVLLEQKRKRLSNTSRGTENRNGTVVGGRRREAADGCLGQSRSKSLTSEHGDFCEDQV